MHDVRLLPWICAESVSFIDVLGRICPAVAFPVNSTIVLGLTNKPDFGVAVLTGQFGSVFMFVYMVFQWVFNLFCFLCD